MSDQPDLAAGYTLRRLLLIYLLLPFVRHHHPQIGLHRSIYTEIGGARNHIWVFGPVQTGNHGRRKSGFIPYRHKMTPAAVFQPRPYMPPTASKDQSNKVMRRTCRLWATAQIPQKSASRIPNSNAISITQPLPRFDVQSREQPTAQSVESISPG